MEITVFDDYQKLSAAAATLIAAQIYQKPNSVLGFATGSTPLKTYQYLVKFHQQQGLDFSKIISFNLDEYLGLAPNHRQSYAYYMQKHLFGQVNIKQKNIYFPTGNPQCPQEACQKYQQHLKELGPLDLQILGLGANGHIGFNEPANELNTSTFIACLSPQTRADNARFFDSQKEVPHYAISMGITSIMQSKKILLLAAGTQKQQAIKKALQGNITTQVPASLLQTHPFVNVFVDNQAADLLT